MFGRIREKLPGFRNYRFVSFPKSGRTWIQLMVYRYVADLTRADLARLLESNELRTSPTNTISFSHGYQNARVAQGDCSPLQMYAGKEVFLLLRHPRDILLSYYHYAKFHLHTFDGTLWEFVTFDNSDPALTGDAARYGIKAIVNYYNAWFEMAPLMSSLRITTYEAFRSDVWLELLNLIGPVTRLDLSGLAAAIEYGSMENMRLLEGSNELNWYGLSGQGRGAKVRVAEQERERFSEEQKNYIRDFLNDHLSPLARPVVLGKRNAPADEQ